MPYSKALFAWNQTRFGCPCWLRARILFYDLSSHSKLKVINLCDEQSAGFAADDAYARIQGLAAVCIITYCVGALKKDSQCSCSSIC
jgi:TPP-dependent 2-oxoacid decarboxylase